MYLWRTEGLIGCCVICVICCCDQTRAKTHQWLHQTDHMTSPRVCVWVCETFANGIIWKDVLMGQMIIVLSWHELHNRSQVILKFPLSGKFGVICSLQHVVLLNLLIDCIQGSFPWSWWWNISTIRLFKTVVLQIQVELRTGCWSVKKKKLQ